MAMWRISQEMGDIMPWYKVLKVSYGMGRDNLLLIGRTGQKRKTEIKRLITSYTSHIETYSCRTFLKYMYTCQ